MKGKYEKLKQELKLTYLFITHNLLVARFFCDRIAYSEGTLPPIVPRTFYLIQTQTTITKLFILCQGANFTFSTGVQGWNPWLGVVPTHLLEGV
jgi:ABC-type methionine transport system ATPase subunit